MIANCGSDERKAYHGGKAGDQTGKEYAVIPWYNRPWLCVLRYPDKAIGEKIASLARAAALNNHVGYDQYERLTFYTQLKAAGWDPAKITVDCETDCSASTAAIIIAVGHIKNIARLQRVEPTMTTSWMEKGLISAGFDVYKEKRFLTSDDYLLPGDILLYPSHHVAINLDTGKSVKGASKSLTQVAVEVIDGKWGNGDKRKAALTAAGWNYTEVQAEVNRLVKLGA